MQGDGPSKPSPVVRRPLAPTGPTISPATMGASRAESVSTPARPAPMASAVRSPLSGGQVTLAYHHLAVAGIAVACLCVICFFLGRRFPGEVLPVTEKHPTFQEVRDKGVTGGLIAPPARRALPRRHRLRLKRRALRRRRRRPGRSTACESRRWRCRSRP